MPLLYTTANVVYSVFTKKCVMWAVLLRILMRVTVKYT